MNAPVLKRLKVEPSSLPLELLSEILLKGERQSLSNALYHVKEKGGPLLHSVRKGGFMDTFSHAILGFVMGHALRLDKKTRMTLLLSCVILDADVLAGVLGWRVLFQFHRGPVHSFVIAAVVALVMALVYVYMRLPLKFLSISVVCLLGVYSHLFLDLLTPWSTDVLWPFSTRGVTLSITPFFDPLFFGILGVAFLLIAYAKSDKKIQLIAVAALIIVLVSFGARVYEKNAAISLVQPPADVIAEPNLNPGEWWVAVTIPQNDGYIYKIYNVNAMTNEIGSVTTLESPFINYKGPAEPPIDSPEKAVAYSRENETVKTFLERATLPAVKVTYDGRWYVFWYDASMEMGERGGHGMGIMATVDEDGTLVVGFSFGSLEQS